MKNKAKVEWSRSPDALPREEREAVRAALERKRVPRAYEQTVRDYFGLGKQ